MMIDNSQFSVYDGSDDEIIFSNIFNIYSKELKISPIGGYKLIFSFLKSQTESSNLKIEPDDDKKEIRITLINFGTSLGTGTNKKIQIMTIGSGQDKKDILFSLFGSSLDDSLDFLQVTLTIYVR